MNMTFSSVLLTGMCLASSAWGGADVEGSAHAVHLNVSVLYTAPPPAVMPQSGPFGLPNMPAMPSGFGDVQQAITDMRDRLSNFQSLAFNSGITDVAAAYVEYVRNAVAANVVYSTQNQDEIMLEFLDDSTAAVQGFLEAPPMMVQEGWFFGANVPNIVIVVPSGGFFAP